MKIHLRQIPADGLHLEGEEECPLAELAGDDARCAGPLEYALDVGISGDALWASGRLVQPVELRCVCCLEPFVHDVQVNGFAIHIEPTGPETVDFTPFMREDILLNLPAYPRCDREGGRACDAAALGAAASSSTPAHGAARQPDWSALDQLGLGDKTGS